MNDDEQKKIDEFRKQVETQIEVLKKFWPTEYKMTIIIRDPASDLKTILLSDDTLDEAFRIITMMKINAEKSKNKVDIVIPKVILN